MAKTDKSSRVSYFNTLIFTIISGIISLMLLFALLSTKVRETAFYFIIAVEVGIFVVIAFCLWQIVYNESVLNSKKRDLLKQRLSFSECPDYYIKKEEKDATYCLNNFTIKDYSGTYAMRIYPSSESLPLTLPNTSTPGDKIDNKNEKFKLYHIEQSDKLKDARSECNVVLNEPPTTNEFTGYSKVPWTHARSRCAPYVEL